MIRASKFVIIKMLDSGFQPNHDDAEPKSVDPATKIEHVDSVIVAIDIHITSVVLPPKIFSITHGPLFLSISFHAKSS